MGDLDTVREEWNTMFKTTLPRAAKARDPAQSRWPVTLDHCFARIILDKVVADNKSSWDDVIGKPAVRNMNEDQFKAAIQLGREILDGRVDLCELDKQSLLARGKNEQKYNVKTAAGTKRQSTIKLEGENAQRKKVRVDEQEPKQLPSPEPEQDNSANTERSTKDELESDNKDELIKGISNTKLQETFRRIQSSSITPYRKRLYTILLSVPAGRYTTYQAMSDFLGSAARAVGNGMRNNIFQPDVPCHRVLASDGSIGGFGGEWLRKGKGNEQIPSVKSDGNGKEREENGMRTAKKISMLTDEGVKFDSIGKVKGPVFREFWDEAKFQKGFRGLSL